VNAFAQYNVELPMPLTDVNQSGYDWFKFSHIEFLLNPRVSSLKLVEQGALIRLMAHAARQVPFGSLPNDPQLLAAMTCLTLQRWNKIADVVLDAAFVQCNDDRWYCPLMIDELSPVVVTHHATTDESSKDAERARRYREKKKRDAKRDDLSTVTNQERDASVTHRDDTVTASVTHRDDTVTNGGIKGGDLDQDSDLDLEVKQKHTSAEPSAARVSAFKTEILEVFEHWKTVFNKNSATKLDDKRKTKIAARLKDGYTVDQIKQAINGCAASEYHVQHHHTDIELICRDAVKIDKFIEMSSVAKKPSPPKPLSGAVNQNFPESRITIPPTLETIAALKKMQDELEC
jgi:uncharacterized protein YdaU (DUF1376 family)